MIKVYYGIKGFCFTPDTVSFFLYINLSLIGEDGAKIFWGKRGGSTDVKMSIWK